MEGFGGCGHSIASWSVFYVGYKLGSPAQALTPLLQRGHARFGQAANVIGVRLKVILRGYTFRSRGLGLSFCQSSCVSGVASRFVMYFVKLFRCVAKESVSDML